MLKYIVCSPTHPLFLGEKGVGGGGGWGGGGGGGGGAEYGLYGGAYSESKDFAESAR